MNEFVTCLERLKAARNSFDPMVHPILLDFKEKVQNSQEESMEDIEVAEDDENGDVVLGQVDKSLKCPLTKMYLQHPVTSRVCKHSYSREAIIDHIKRRQEWKF